MSENSTSDDNVVLLVVVDDVSGSTECIEFDGNTGVRDAMAPDNVMGIPLFLEEDADHDIGTMGPQERVDSSGRPNFRIDVKTLLNLDDTSVSDDAPDVMSPNSTSISQAMSAAGLHPQKDLPVLEEEEESKSSMPADLNSIGELSIHGEKSHVQEVRRTAHARFNPQTNKFEGLPAEWQSQFTQKFGLPLQLCATEAVPGYSARLPPILVEMKEYLINHGGLSTKGIFRLAPEKEEAAAVKQQFNDGVFQGCGDVNIIANQIKVWFRDMPAKLLDQSMEGPASILTCSGVDEAGAVIMQKFRDPHQTLLLWLLDLCVLVSDQSSVNLMTPQNMAIVFSPNLCKIADASNMNGKSVDSVKLMSDCTKYTSFLENAIVWRKQTTAKKE